MFRESLDFLWQSFLICLNGMNGVTKLYRSPRKKKNKKKQSVTRISLYEMPSLQSFHSSVMAQTPLREKNKTQRWNEDFSPKYYYRAFCKVLFKAIRNRSWKLARREKYFVFNVRIFYLEFFSLVKSFCLPFAKQRLLHRCQSGFEFSRCGLKMSTVNPEKWLRRHGVMRLMPK